MPLLSQDKMTIPDEGITFDVSVGRGEDTKIQQITLLRLLQGVNINVSPNATGSQAQLLANRLVWKGYDTEAKAIEAFPRIDPTQSWRIIQILANSSNDDRVARTIKRWTEEGRTISKNQMGLATALIPVLKEHNFEILANRINEALQSDEVLDVPMAAPLFSMINKAQNLIPSSHELSAASADARRRKGQATAQDKANDDDELDEQLLDPEMAGNINPATGDPF